MGVPKLKYNILKAKFNILLFFLILSLFQVHDCRHTFGGTRVDSYAGAPSANDFRGRANNEGGRHTFGGAEVEKGHADAPSLNDSQGENPNKEEGQVAYGSTEVGGHADAPMANNYKGGNSTDQKHWCYPAFGYWCCNKVPEVCYKDLDYCAACCAKHAIC